MADYRDVDYEVVDEGDGLGLGAPLMLPSVEDFLVGLASQLTAGNRGRVLTEALVHLGYASPTLRARYEANPAPIEAWAAGLDVDRILRAWIDARRRGHLPTGPALLNDLQAVGGNTLVAGLGAVVGFVGRGILDTLTEGR